MLLEKDKAYIESLTKDMSLEDINELNSLINKRKRNYYDDLISRLESLNTEKKRISEDIVGLKSELEAEARRLKLAGDIKQSREMYDIVNEAVCSKPRFTSIELIYENPYLKDLHVGDTVAFGAYSQGMDSGVTAPILWVALDVEGGNALLLSKYCIECKALNDERSAVTWKESTLCKWLNGELINSFSNGEQSLIVTKNNEMITILGRDEHDYYLKTENSRACLGTVHTLRNADHFIDSTAVSYWIKQDISDPAHASAITPIGSICPNKILTDKTVGVRPALWVRFQ